MLPGSMRAVRRVIQSDRRNPAMHQTRILTRREMRFSIAQAPILHRYLKRNPITEYQLALIDKGYAVESWQGVRADESESRRWLPSYEDRGGRYAVYRPILRWTVADMFEAHAAAGIKPNPLYRQGMSRVGCMPCISASKAELREIARRFTEHIERSPNGSDWFLRFAARARR
jgi:3'-phosphoadenosine 5'-phosphosulfate sulfotransferase (PAPS reductase)/FAD synthetase